MEGRSGVALAPRSTSSFSGASGAGLLLSFGAVSIRPASVRRCILRRPSASPASDCSSSGRRDPGCSCARWGRLISAQIRCAPMWSRKIRAAHALKMPSWFVGCSRSGCKILGRLGRRRWQRRLWLSFSSRRGPPWSCFSAANLLFRCFPGENLWSGLPDRVAVVSLASFPSWRRHLGDTNFG